MTTSEWFLFFLILQVVHSIGTWKMYVCAGRKAWESIIPVYNAIVLFKIIGKPTWWTILLFIPIINLIMFPIVWVETLKSFGKNSTADKLFGVFSLGLYVLFTNYSPNLQYVSDKSLQQETKVGDTVSSLLFAIIVATIVHTYFIQPFTIPTSSLEKSLLVGDFLFVSKVNYGARTPMTTVSLPMVHDTIPFTKNKSYLTWPELPYFRFPGFQSIERNDIVVFNWPVDTVYKFRDNSGQRVDKPIDKKSNYVKRCVGIPGDELQIKDGVVFVNGKELILPERARPQFSYKVALDGKTPIDFEYLMKDMDITDGAGFMDAEKRDTIFFAALTKENAERLKNIPGITAVQKIISNKPEPAVFPHTNKWNNDNFGPIYIPKKGKTVALNMDNLPLYKTIITDYEKNKLKVENGKIFINDKLTTSYTFGQDYFWMMGDNRHNSEDSRYWGYVPENHVVGKPIFIWMSIKGINDGVKNWKIRWDRLFTTVSGEGQPQSYFKYFLMLLVAYFIGEYFWKKRKSM